jgi:hypothetical protein
MQGTPRPSAIALKAAGDLGRLLAKTEPQLTPDLRWAHEYKSYLQFIMAHRHLLEQKTAFEPWEAEIQRLTVSEGRRCHLQVESPAEWERLYTGIGVLLRCAFWYGWEVVYEMQRRYEQRMELALERSAVARPLHVAGSSQWPSAGGSGLLDGFGEWADLSASPRDLNAGQGNGDRGN